MILMVMLTASLLVVSQAGAAQAETSDNEYKENISQIQAELRRQGYQGDTSEAALREAYEGTGGMSARAKPNGCSTPTFTHIITKKYNKLFKPACNKHDVCYSSKSKTSRKSCDKKFLTNMRNICFKKYGKPSNPRIGKSGDCTGTAGIYYNSVRAFGKSHYKGKGSKA